MTSKTVILLGTTVLASLFILSSCSSKNRSTPDNSAISPNGKYIAVVYAKSDGATSGEIKVEISSRRLFVSSDKVINNKKVANCKMKLATLKG